MNTERSDKGDYPPNTTKILAKLRQLLRLKEQNLITEEEYTRKRAQMLEKW